MNKLSLAFFGTPYFSAGFLEKILTDTTINQLIEVRLVVTQPDRPVGKKQILTASPVKIVAQQFENLIIENSLKIENLKLKIKKTDLALVCAYGQIIPQELLTLPKYGFWNIHYSLLPKYRGASPAACALMAGEKKTGVTIFQMDEKIDHGPIIVQEEIKILPDDRRPELEKKLTDLAFEMFKKLITSLQKKAKIPVLSQSLGGPPAQAGVKRAKNTASSFFNLIQQNHSLATYTKKLTKQDGFIPFENLKLEIKNSPEKIFNLFRGLYPWPGIWTILPSGKRLKITDMNLGRINRVQLEGKKEVDFRTFNRAYKIL